MKISKRLKAIADMVDNNAFIVDVGCDHALLSIYLVKEKNVTAIASDVNINALTNARKNIDLYKLSGKIETTLTDGVNGIDIANKTIIICGMGTRTICEIIDNISEYNMNDLIIQSNHEIEYLRRFMVSKGFFIVDEVFIIDRKKPYVLIKFRYEKNRKNDYKYIDFAVGPILKNKQPEYLKFVIKNKEHVLSKIPYRYFIYRYKIKKEIRILKKEI